MPRTVFTPNPKDRAEFLSHVPVRPVRRYVIDPHIMQEALRTTDELAELVKDNRIQPEHVRKIDVQIALLNMKLLIEQLPAENGVPLPGREWDGLVSGASDYYAIMKRFPDFASARDREIRSTVYEMLQQKTMNIDSYYDEGLYLQTGLIEGSLR